MTKPSAFILLGGLRVIVRNWLYLTELERRGLQILVITSEGWREEAAECMATPGSPGSLIDEVGFVEGSVEVDGSFTPGVVSTVREWCKSYEIVGVFAAGEMMVEQTSIVADVLGLPSPGIRAGRACRSKYLQRFYLPEWSPEVAVVAPSARKSPDLSGISFPVVLKPSSRRSSSGVRRIGDEDELMNNIDDYGDSETLLVEEYVTGHEFSVEALVQHGRVIFESVTRKRTNESDSDWFAELGHTVSGDTGDAVHAELVAATRSIVQRLGFADGVLHAELRVPESGRPLLMEVAARTPGDGILPLYYLATGHPMETEIIRIALAEPAEYPSPSRMARQVYLEHDSGVLEDVRLRWPATEISWVAEGKQWPTVIPGASEDEAALRNVLVLKEPGSRLGPIRESGDRAVTFLIDACSLTELDDIEQRVRDSIDVVVKGDGLLR